MVDSEARVFLKKQISADIFYIDIDVTVKSTEKGPGTDFTIRFFPINAETDVVTLKSQESLAILAQRKGEIEKDLAETYGDGVKAIVHQIIPELDQRQAEVAAATTAASNKNLIVAHVWNDQEEIIPPAEVISKLISRESEEFLLEYKVVGIKNVEDETDDGFNVLYVVIGVLGGALLITIIVAIITVKMLKDKFDRKQKAANVLNEVNAGMTHNL